MRRSRFDWGNWPLAAKLTLAMTTMIVVAVVSVTLLSLYREQQTFQAELQEQAGIIVDVMATTTADSLYYLDVDRLSDITKNLRREDIVVHARVYDPDGRIIADAYDETLAHRFQINAFGQRLVQSDTILFEWQSDRLLAGQAVSVGGQRLGAVSVGLPTDPLQAKMAAVRNQGAVVALATAVIGIFVALLIGRSITVPLQDLVQATQHIAAGDLTHVITTQNSDEIAVLGNALERMRAELHELYTGLERQVTARTLELSQANRELEAEIAERKRAEEAIRQLNAELEQRVANRTQALAAANERLTELDRLKSKFVSDVSHELRTPVTNLKLYLDLLEHSSREKKASHLVILKRQTNRLQHLIEDILDLSRLEAEKAGLKFDAVDLNEIVEQVITTHRPQIETADLTLHFEPCPDLPPVWAAESQLSQVVTNLLANAIAYTAEGSIRVSTFLNARPDQSCLQIADTGIGIAPEEKQHLFDRFYRGERVGQLNIPGTGLGLSIVKEIVDLHQGRIEVESAEGVGSTFRVWLPVAGEQLLIATLQ